jgi:serine/threonine protein kinase
VSDLQARLAGAFAGRYAVEGELGAGGMASVYLARDLKHDRMVAIKVLRPELTGVVGEGRFLREIRTVANLQHPHILGLIDSGEIPDGAYYVMPYVDGRSLRDRLDRERLLPIVDAVRIACEVAAALDYAHRHGVIHRDIKPENILLHEGQALVADFGIALATAGDGTRITQTGIMLGTPHYMSPEQVTGEHEITARADVYALGALTYEMLAGEPPFTGRSAQAILAKVMTQKPKSLRSHREMVPEAVEAVVMTALQKVAADRFATAAEFQASLSGAIQAPASGSRGTPASRTVAATPRVTRGTFRISEVTCRRLSRGSFDPRLIGSDMSYLDNGVASDVLVCYFAACGRGGDQFEDVLRKSPYRGVAPTFRGFEVGLGWRPAFSIDDHIVLVRESLREIVAREAPAVVIVAGFSSGGDFALRFAAAPDPDARLGLDGCLTLGANLSSETCFMTSALATLQSSDDDAMLAILRGATNRASTLDEWVNVCEYVTHIVPVFRHDAAPLRAFGAAIVAPFEAGPLAAFADWYRAATNLGRHVRCVFEDTTMYRNLVRELQVRNLDHGLLGDRYEELSVVTDAGTNHFDLLQPARISRHLESLVDAIRRTPRR